MESLHSSTFYLRRGHQKKKKKKKKKKKSMVQVEINIKLSTINSKDLNRLIARKETRNSAIAERPRCKVGT